MRSNCDLLDIVLTFQRANRISITYADSKLEMNMGSVFLGWWAMGYLAAESAGEKCRTHSPREMRTIPVKY